MGELLSPCKNAPVPIAQCVKEKRDCSACVPAAKFVMKGVKDGMSREQVEKSYKNRFSPDQIQKSINDLQSTQKQLVQQAKLASLGELTAGIAHEIQNPLNFVNNFAELNMELIAEIKDLIGETQPALAEVINDVNENSNKILFHGRRADNIVKSMLQHSRRNAGSKEPTDIYALADEYL